MGADGIEGVALALDWLLSGTIGVGTALYALTNGSLLQIFLPIFEYEARREAAPLPS